MEWLTSIRAAIDYMERHLRDDIRVEDVAAEVPEARSMLMSVTPLTPRMARSALALQWLHDMPLI